MRSASSANQRSARLGPNANESLSTIASNSEATPSTRQCWPASKPSAVVKGSGKPPMSTDRSAQKVGLETEMRMRIVLGQGTSTKSNPRRLGPSASNAYDRQLTRCHQSRKFSENSLLPCDLVRVSWFTAPEGCSFRDFKYCFWKQRYSWTMPAKRTPVQPNCVRQPMLLFWSKEDLLTW